MCKPSIIMIGVPNSGTSIMAKMYNVFGWHFEPDHKVQEQFMHLGWLSRPATLCATTSCLARVTEARRELRAGFSAATRPVIAKQHNLSWCLDVFTDIILAIEPGTVLVLVEKDSNLIKRSTQLRLNRADPNVGWLDRGISGWVKAARQQYDRWPSSKRVVRYATVREAVSRQDGKALLRELGIEQYDIDDAAVREAMDLFDPTRDDEGNPYRGSDGWEYPRCG